MARDAISDGRTGRDRLAERRKALGLTQDALAYLLGVERTTVTRWECGESAPQPWVRPRLAKELRVSADRLEELLGGPAATRRDGVGTVPRQLPPAVADFTGRAAELAALTTGADDAAAGAPGTVVISAIGGTAGVGKTALAVHWAHQVAGRFGDGQLYVNLRGFDPSGAPVTTAEALRGFLEALGVRPDRIPSALDAQAGLYRGMLSERKMLIVLDNAGDEQQVRPLLPASPGSLVIVTSRNQLSGLAAADGARLLTIDVLTHGEAVRLLTVRLGRARAAAEPEAIADIATRCGCLPLALSVAAARAGAHPDFPLTALAAELRDASDRLDALDAGNPSASVRAVFSWSYRQLSTGAGGMFRLLGVHPGPDISVPAAASLAAIGESAARRLLRELTRSHLTTEPAPGRCGLHDLLRAYAADQARDIDSAAERAAATNRALDHYLHTAYAVATVIHPGREPVALAPPSPGAVPEPVSDYRQAMSWFQAEHAVLLAAVACAARSGFDRHAWQLPCVMAEYLERRGHWHERIAVLGTGLAAAIRLGDTAGEAASRRLLGHAYYRVGDYEQAGDHLRHSARLHLRLGDRRGEAKAHTVLASMAEKQGRDADAIGHLEEALRLFREARHPAGEAEILNNIGWYHALLGDFEQTRAYCRRSLALSAEHDDRHITGHAWDSLGYAEHHLGNLQEAIDCYERALIVFREFGHRYFEAGTLSNLGDTRQAGGDLPRATEAWREALAIFDDLQHPNADKVRGKLGRVGQERLYPGALDRNWTGMLVMADGAVAKRERLAQRRKAVGLTQEGLAALLGVKRTTVVRWERGESKPLPLIWPKLARALRVSADQIGELLASDAPAATRHGGGAGQNAAVVPRQLPAAVADFTGRDAELATLTRILDDAGGAAGPGTVVISAIGGTAGVGKTALALHWAHRVAGRFGDGQLYANLRGFDPSGTPATPAEAIRGFLDALGVPPERIPPLPDAQAGMYRGLLADKKMLIVLDNARDEQQVRPLLPASPASLVIVTSRNQLTGLAGADGARLLPLDVLSHPEAVLLLATRVGPSRAASESGPIAEIATLCACLPIALAIAAARAAARPGFPLSVLAAELRDTPGRLEALDADDPAASVRAVFSWSYQQLSSAAARMFRLLGLHPGPDISVPAAASLAAATEPAARRLLQELSRECLITEHIPGRYAFHDLLRAYAAGQARAIDTEAERAAAAGRLLDHYLHTAHGAAFLLEASRLPIALAAPRPGATPEQLADYERAMEWCQAEHQVLMAAITLAANTGFDVHAWQIPWAIADFLDRRGRWQDKVAVQRTAVAAAMRLGDTAGQIESRRLLGTACSRVGDHDQARGHLEQCLTLYQRIGDRPGEAKTHLFLGGAAARQGRHADALGHAEDALRVYRAIGDKPGEATLLNNIGYTHAQLGDYLQSREYSRRALTLCTEIGRRSTEAYAWDSLGYAESHLGNLAEAETCYSRALSLSRELRDRVLEADVLTHLGDSRHAGGDLPRARDAWRRALVIYEELSHPDAGKVGAVLAGLAPSVAE